MPHLTLNPALATERRNFPAAVAFAECALEELPQVEDAVPCQIGPWTWVLAARNAKQEFLGYIGGNT
jgi:hypothetical protein